MNTELDEQLETAIALDDERERLVEKKSVVSSVVETDLIQPGTKKPQILQPTEMIFGLLTTVA